MAVQGLTEVVARVGEDGGVEGEGGGGGRLDCDVGEGLCLVQVEDLGCE